MPDPGPPPPNRPAASPISPPPLREFKDRGTLWLLEDPHNLQGLLRLASPSLADALDFSRAQRVNRSFIPADLQKQESDLIFRLPFKDGHSGLEVWVYVLLEHQSKPDALMALHILGYMVQIWQAQVREWERKRTPHRLRKLTPIVPMVFYTGKRRWKGSLRLADLMEVGAGLEGFVPEWESLRVDLHAMTPEALTEIAGAVGWALRVMQVEGASLERFEGVLGEALAGIEGLSEEQSGQWLQLAWFLLLEVIHHRSRAESEVLEAGLLARIEGSKFRERGEVTKMAKSWAQTVAEEAEARGRVEGEARGRVEGEARGEAQALRRALSTILQARFGELPDAVSDGIAHAEVAQLDAWLQTAGTVGTLTEVGIGGGEGS